MKYKNAVVFRLLTVIFYNALFTNCFAQKFSQPYGTEADYKRLLFLNQLYIQSWVRSDTATYNKFLWAEDFVHLGSDGLFYPKKNIGEIFGKKRLDQLQYFYAANVTIQFISDNAAMVMAETPLQLAGQSNETLSRCNDIYVKRNGQWVCVSANVSAVSDKEDKPFSNVALPNPPDMIQLYNGSEQDVKALHELNQKHAAIFLGAKPEYTGDVLAHDFILLATNGNFYRKPAVTVLAQQRATVKNVYSYEFENLQIRFAAADIAMIQAVLVATCKDAVKYTVQYNDVYVKRGGKWVCVFGYNVYPINKAG